MQSHRSLASDFPSLSIPSRGTVRAFGKPFVAQRLGFPTTPSADFCPAVKAGFPSFSRCRFRVDDTWQISRGKTRIIPRVDAGFTTCTLAGVATGAVDEGLRGHVPARPERATPQIRFVYLVPRFRLGLPPHPASRRRTCPLANLRLYMPGTGTFTRLDSCHARHTRLSSADA